MPVSISGTNGVTFPDSSLQAAAASPYVNKNRLINGAMQVWQRGTSVTTSGGYTADRWAEVSGNSNQHIQSTDAPTNFGYSMQIIGVGGNINQRIESLNCQDLSGQTITISFWVKNTSGTDSLVLQLYYANTADTFSSLTQVGSTVTISSNPSSSWTQYTTTFTSLPAGSKNGLSLYLARTGTGSVSTTWYMTGIQLEIGTSATPFERRFYGQELANCQRYFEKSYAQGTVLGTASAYPAYGTSFNGMSNTSGQKFIISPFKITKRASPTITYYDSAGTLGKITTVDIGGTFTNNVSIALGFVNDSQHAAAPSNGTHTGLYYDWAASAEL
jgi:hypothetical protein